MIKIGALSNFLMIGALKIFLTNLIRCSVLLPKQVLVVPQQGMSLVVQHGIENILIWTMMLAKKFSFISMAYT